MEKVEKREELNAREAVTEAITLKLTEDNDLLLQD